MRIMNKINILLISSLLVLISCKEIVKSVIKNTIEDSSSESISDYNFNTVEVDSLYTLSIPKYMKVMNNLNDEASLQYGNIYKDVYTVVINEDKQDFIDYFKEIGEYNDKLSVIDNYAYGQVNYFKEQIVDDKVEPYGLAKIKDYSARQYKIKGKIDGIEIGYIIAYIETEGDLFMIMNWTSLNRFSRFENTFEVITASFEYILNSKKTNEVL